MVPAEILNTLHFEAKNCEPLYGGDINRCFKVVKNGKKFFLKINDANLYPAMFQKEANGLKWLSENCRLKIPGVAEVGFCGTWQYLLLEFLEAGVPGTNSEIQFGQALADMHRIPQPYFGFNEDNYIGSLPQLNSIKYTWQALYTECRVMPLIKMLVDNKTFSSTEINSAAAFCKRINGIFPSEPAALLHGDLWSGNFMATANDNMALYDPAVYFGHREMDIGMTMLFGGFSTNFYIGYNQVYPLENLWQQRLPYTQLYPLLVHAVLFGGQYVFRVKEILQPFKP